jgi:hypothetical protein
MTMRHLLTAALVIVGAAGPTADLLACGDKYLVPARGLTFRARQDAAILLYGTDASQLLRSINELSIPATLQKAGYRPTVVRTGTDFTSALSKGGWDLVVVDPTDRPPLADQVRKASGPAVLAVNYTLSGDLLKLARQDYTALVKAPKNSGAFLEMIDSAVEKHRTTKKKKP